MRISRPDRDGKGNRMESIFNHKTKRLRAKRVRCVNGRRVSDRAGNVASGKGVHDEQVRDMESK